MKKVVAFLLIFVLILSAAACESGGTKPGDSTQPKSSAQESGEGKSITVALVTSKRGDMGFNDQAWLGCQMAVKDFGIKLLDAQATDMAEADAAIRNFSDAGDVDLIVVVGANYTETLAMIADEYPEQKYSMVDAILLPEKPNVSSNATIDGEQGFLSGVISGLVTRGDFADSFPRANSDKNVIVYAGGMDSPVSRAGAAGYMAGVLYVNPECKIIYNIVGSYQDPVKAKEIAMSGVAQGADIITGNCGSGSLGLNEAAIEAGCYFIATSMAGLDPVCSLCTSVKLTENEVYDEIKAVVEGKFTSGGERLGIASGYCDVSLEGVQIDYPQELIDIVNEIRERVKRGEIVMPNDVTELDEWKANNQYK
jgi:basic membrane protein A